jgi:hypothetical protein
MSLKESIKRLQQNDNDTTALAEFFNHFEGFIHSLINQYKHTIYGMNEQDIEQELKLQMVKRIDSIDTKMDDKQIEQYLLNTLRNKMTILHRRAVPAEEAYAKPIHEPIEEGEEGRTYEDVIDSGEKGLLEALEFPNLISQVYDKVGPGSKRIIQLLLEGLNKSQVQEKLHEERVKEQVKKYRRQKGKELSPKEMKAIDESTGPSKKSILRVFENEIIPALKSVGIEEGVPQRETLEV